MSAYQPPYTITATILNQVATISETIGRLTALADPARALRLRRANRIRTVHGSLAIEGNTLSEAQVSAVLEGKRVIAPPRDLQEVKNALAAYDHFDTWNPHSEHDLLDAHRVLMAGLLADGNGRMGRLWQSLILARWHPVFGDLPVESLVHAHQAEYYLALEDSNQRGDSAPFITYMLRMIDEAVRAVTHHVTHQVAPQVAALFAPIRGAMGRRDLQAALGLSDRVSFRERYLKPALKDALIEMTRPEKPTADCSATASPTSVGRGSRNTRPS